MERVVIPWTCKPTSVQEWDLPEGYGGSSSSTDGLVSAEAFYVSSKGRGKGNGKGFGKYKPNKKGNGKGGKNSLNAKRKLVQKLQTKAPNAAAGGLAKMQCWLCKGFGHSQRQCPNNRA